LSPAQKKAYNEIVEDLVTQLDNGEIVAVTAIIAKLVRLKQISISLGLLSEDIKDSSKIDILMDMIDGIGDESMVVFSQFARAIGLLHARLTAARVPHVVLTGAHSLLVDADGTTHKATRGEVVKAFQAKQYPIYIGTTQAGGVGITLTVANTVVFMDKMWNPALQSQAEDRLHRIGQKDSVMVVSIIAKDTIEEQIEKMLARKTVMIEDILKNARRKGKLVHAIRLLTVDKD
jgi:SNF2 family DNA or RNA helicase